MKKIQQNYFLKCIESISIVLDKHHLGGKEDHVSVFIKDNIYMCTESNSNYVEISEIKKKNVNVFKDNNAKLSIAKFVLDSKIFDSPGVYNHFEIYEEVPDGITAEVTYNGRWEDSRYSSYDRSWVSDSIKKDISLSQLKGENSYSSNKIYCTLNVLNEPVIGSKLKFDLWKLKYLKTKSNLLHLSLDVGMYTYNKKYKGDLSIIKLKKGLLNLDIRNGVGRESKNELINIDDLKIPNTVEFLYLNRLSLKELPKIKNASIKTHSCKIQNLSLKNIKDFSFSNIEFETYDNLYYSKDVSLDLYQNDYIGNVTILKISEDIYSISDSSRNVTKKEAETFCATFQLYDAMKIFDFDLNTRFNLTTNGWSDKETNIYDFREETIKGKGKEEKTIVKIKKKGEYYQLNDYTSFDFYNHRTYLLYSKKEGIHIQGDYDFSSGTETINDVSLNVLLKLSEDERFPDGFFDNFMKAVNKSKSRYVGEIDIKDFKFSMLKGYENIRYLYYIHKNKTWNISYKGIGTKYIKDYTGNNNDYYVDEDRNYSDLIDWGKQDFKLKNLNKSATYINHNNKEYYKILTDNKEDAMYLLKYGKYNRPKFDESIRYILNISDKELESKGFMIIDDKIYKPVNSEHEYEYDGKNPSNHSFSRGEPINSFYNYLGDNASKITISTIDAKKLAVKYKFKLKLDNIRNIDSKITSYRGIEHIRSCMYGKQNSIDEEIMSFNGGFEKVFMKQNPLNVISEDYSEVLTPIIKVGNNIFILFDCKMLRLIIKEGKVIVEKEKDKNDNFSSGGFYKILKDNNYSFSYLSLDLKQEMIDKVEFFLGTYKKVLCISFIISNILKTDNIFLRIGLYSTLNYYYFGSGYKDNDFNKNLEKASKNEMKILEDVIQPSLKKLFDKTTILKTNKLINVINNIKDK